MPFYQVPEVFEHFLKVKRVFVYKLRIDTLYFSGRYSFPLPRRDFVNVVNFMLFDASICYRQSADDLLVFFPLVELCMHRKKLNVGTTVFQGTFSKHHNYHT